MATTKNHPTPPPQPAPPPTPTDIYVHADPTTFRAVVQKLTGAPEGSPSNLPLTTPPPRRPAKKPRLHERRLSLPKLEIKLGRHPYHYSHHSKATSYDDAGFVSPVSTMDAAFFSSSPSPGSASTLPPPKLLDLFPLCSPRDSHYAE